MITQLEPNEIFVFGSNLAGRHGKGAAKYAYIHFGAESGEGYGRMGRCYALPTKDYSLRTLPLNEIQGFIRGFLKYANSHPELRFLVTEIGCGLAGYTPAQIGPLFQGLIPDNVVLPDSFLKSLHQDT